MNEELIGILEALLDAIYKGTSMPDGQREGIKKKIEALRSHMEGNK